MQDPQTPPAPPPWLTRGSGLSLAAYLVVLVIGIWMIVHFILQIQLTELLSRAITISGAEWVMYLLIGLSILSVGVTFERWLFYRKRAVDLEPTRQKLQELLEEGRSAEALRFAETLPGMEGKAIAACLKHLDQGTRAMEDEMRAALVQEKLEYDRNLVILGTLGNNAPFIGLFGTVLGIVKAFMNLAEDLSGGAAAVMGGISEALVATAIGLLVAIPSVVAFNALKSKVRVIVSNAEYLARTVMAGAKPPPPGKPTTAGSDGI